MSAIELTQEEKEFPGNQDLGRQIARKIANKHGVPFRAMMGPQRYSELVAARRELYQALKAEGWTNNAIARLVHRHHTTVLWALEGKPEGNIR
jgi:chromosomal replication initiation ATPase DnaA